MKHSFGEKKKLYIESNLKKKKRTFIPHITQRNLGGEFLQAHVKVPSGIWREKKIKRVCRSS